MKKDPLCPLDEALQGSPPAGALDKQPGENKLEVTGATEAWHGTLSGVREFPEAGLGKRAGTAMWAGGC